MLFNLEFDHGDRIEGYLIPDGFSENASIVISKDDGTTIFLPCLHERVAVKQSGRHETGLVGFVIDQTIIEDLEQQQNLSIHDATTNLLIYRRAKEGVLQKKLLRLEMSIVPQPKLDAFCSNHFQYAVHAVERFGHETTLQAFHLNAVNSIFISGRLFLRNYEEFLDKGFMVVASFMDPYYEMACRLLTLKGLARGKVTFLDDRDRLSMDTASKHFTDVNLDDDKALIRALKSADERVRDSLSSPITRQLVSTSPQQRVTKRDIAPAINLLSRFSIVGHEDRTHYLQALGELLQVSYEDIPVAPIYSALDNMAQRLRGFPIAETYLEEDLILSHYVRRAISSHT
ncbi:hypothetical protein [Agrobacterium rosae]|uniref:hypothetical protein n=1 Tax=Agrobacterium rosae TaxID=1972867 RepID=UPI003BA30B0D